MLLREPAVKEVGPTTRERSIASNVLTVGKLIAEAALFRRESVGAHFRSDFPAAEIGTTDRLWLSKGGSGRIVPTKPKGTAAGAV